MSKIGRNDACPCGSGQKYKRCCLDKEKAAIVVDDENWQKIRQTEGELVYKLIDYAKHRYGLDAIHEAWEDFTVWKDISEDVPEFENTFIPWFLFNWIPDNTDALEAERLPEKQIALLYFEEFPSCCDKYQRIYIQTICNRPYSFFVVLDVVPSKSLTIRDLFIGEEFTVKEKQGSQSLQRGDIVFARVMPLDGQAVMVGSGTNVIPPNCHYQFIDLREKLEKVNGPLTLEHLHEYDIELRGYYFELVEQLQHPRPPTMINTDGDLVVFAKVYFKLTCTPQEAFDQLSSLNICQSAEDILSEGKYNKHEVLKKVEFDWHKRGNKQHPEWDNTVLGNITIDGDKLTIAVNSEKRSKKIQNEVKKRLGERAIFEKATIESVEKELERQKSRPGANAKLKQENDDFQNLPEVQAMKKQMIEQHWKSWVDQPIPLLKNLTPKQAAKTPDGRVRLEALFLEFERRSKNVTDHFLRPDIEELKRKIGFFDTKCLS